ncbi:FUSC family protein [Halopolyspora algeriensis]|nr:FUSC family protein [Halopolyspora algeriensis]
MTRMRTLLDTEAGAPDIRRQQYATVVLLTVSAATGLGWAFDLAAPALLAGLTAVFTLVGAGGQSLRADLRRLRWFAPALVLVMAGGPLPASLPWVAGLLVAAVVFGAGMLPALGQHYRVLGQTFAAATITSITTGLGANQPTHTLLGAAVLGSLFAVCLRITTGRSDPTRTTRAAVARTLTEWGPGIVEQAATAWRGGNSAVWLGRVLAGAARYRAAREILLAQARRDRTEAELLHRIVDEADTVAAELARAVRASACTGLPPLARLDPLRSVLGENSRQAVPAAARGIDEGLERIRAAVIERDGTTVPAVRDDHRQGWHVAVRAHLSPRSSLFRHALRCTLAVGAGMAIALAMDDPSVSTLLLSLYVVLQPAARDSMTGALERTGGVVLGVAALAVLVALLPGAFLLVPLAVTVMLLRVDWLRADYRTLLGALITVTVADQTLMLQRSPADVAIGFAANTAIGAAIALVVGYLGYLVLPGSLVPDVRGTLRATVRAVAWLLRSVRTTEHGSGAGLVSQSASIPALRRTQDLLGMPALLDGTGADSEDEHSTRLAAVALDSLRQDVATLALRPETERATAVPALHAASDVLAGHTVPEIPGMRGDSSPETESLASALLENALHARTAIDAIFGPDEPWKSYTLSLVRTQHLRIR